MLRQGQVKLVDVSHHKIQMLVYNICMCNYEFTSKSDSGLSHNIKVLVVLEYRNTQQLYCRHMHVYIIMYIHEYMYM